MLNSYLCGVPQCYTAKNKGNHGIIKSIQKFMPQESKLAQNVQLRQKRSLKHIGIKRNIQANSKNNQILNNYKQSNQRYTLNNIQRPTNGQNSGTRQIKKANLNFELQQNRRNLQKIDLKYQQFSRLKTYADDNFIQHKQTDSFQFYQRKNNISTIRLHPESNHNFHGYSNKIYTKFSQVRSHPSILIQQKTIFQASRPSIPYNLKDPQPLVSQGLQQIKNVDKNTFSSNLQNISCLGLIKSQKSVNINPYYFKRQDQILLKKTGPFSPYMSYMPTKQSNSFNNSLKNSPKTNEMIENNNKLTNLTDLSNQKHCIQLNSLKDRPLPLQRKIQRIYQNQTGQNQAKCKNAYPHQTQSTRLTSGFHKENNPNNSSISTLTNDSAPLKQMFNRQIQNRFLQDHRLKDHNEFKILKQNQSKNIKYSLNGSQKQSLNNQKSFVQSLVSSHKPYNVSFAGEQQRNSYPQERQGKNINKTVDYKSSSGNEIRRNSFFELMETQVTQKSSYQHQKDQILESRFANFSQQGEPLFTQLSNIEMKDAESFVDSDENSSQASEVQYVVHSSNQLQLKSLGLLKGFGVEYRCLQDSFLDDR